MSRYAWGADYHELIRERLQSLADFLRHRRPRAQAFAAWSTRRRCWKREFAQLAGLGWIGKNTLLLNKQLGSWFFLAALLTDLELEYDAPARRRSLRHLPGLSRRLPDGGVRRRRTCSTPGGASAI